MSNIPIITHIPNPQWGEVIEKIHDEDIQSDRKQLKIQDIVSVCIVTIINICITAVIIFCNVKKIPNNNIYVVFFIVTILDNILTWLLISHKVAYVQIELERGDTLFNKDIIILLLLFILNNILLGITMYYCIIHILTNIPKNTLYKSLTIFFIIFCFIFRFIIVLIVDEVSSKEDFRSNENDRHSYEQTHIPGEFIDVLRDAGKSKNVTLPEYIDDIIVKFMSDHE